MKKRMLCWLLALVMVFSLLPAFGMNAAAADITDPRSGFISLKKTVRRDGFFMTLSDGITPLQNTKGCPWCLNLLIDRAAQNFAALFCRIGSWLKRKSPVQIASASTAAASDPRCLKIPIPEDDEGSRRCRPPAWKRR